MVNGYSQIVTWKCVEGGGGCSKVKVVRLRYMPRYYRISKDVDYVKDLQRRA